MIICPCTVIPKRDMEDAIRSLLQQIPKPTDEFE